MGKEGIIGRKQVLKHIKLNKYYSILLKVNRVTVSIQTVGYTGRNNETKNRSLVHSDAHHSVCRVRSKAFFGRLFSYSSVRVKNGKNKKREMVSNPAIFDSVIYSYV